MKRTIRTIFLLLLAVAVPLVVASGQESKTEKKIKIVIDEGSGSKTVLDTVFTGASSPEKIELKDGTIVFIGKPDKDLSEVTEGKSVIVTVESDEESGKEVAKTIYVTSGDSQTWTAASTGEKGHVYVISRDKNTGGKSGDHIVISSSGDKAVEWTDKDTDATKYVVAKDGVVITVESDNEEKAKELVKLIQDKLGVKSEEKK